MEGQGDESRHAVFLWGTFAVSGWFVLVGQGEVSWASASMLPDVGSYLPLQEWLYDLQLVTLALALSVCQICCYGGRCSAPVNMYRSIIDVGRVGEPT